MDHIHRLCWHANHSCLARPLPYIGKGLLRKTAGISSDDRKRNGGNGLDFALLLEYGWVLLVLIGLEGILAADNALVMAVMVKHLPENKGRRLYFTDWRAHLFCVSGRCSPFLFW